VTRKIASYQYLIINLTGKIKWGSRGYTSWVASPSRGKRGIILQAAAENKRIERKEDFNRANLVIDHT
jgi:hypothetical protein